MNMPETIIDRLFATELLPVRPRRDDVIDALGYDPRSLYVETYWLSVLGPSTLWLLRRLVAGLELSPDGFDLPMAETARAIGLGDKGGRSSPFVRSLIRLVQFDVAVVSEGRALAVRRKLPPLNQRQVFRLPASLQAAHQRWQEEELRTPTDEHLRRRARQLALSLVDIGEEPEAAERQLLRWRFPASVARQAAAWAYERASAAGQTATTVTTASRPA
jgi:hypothetical protein